jgi:hypothetical protein
VDGIQVDVAVLQQVLTQINTITQSGHEPNTISHHALTPRQAGRKAGRKAGSWTHIVHQRVSSLGAHLVAPSREGSLAPYAGPFRTHVMVIASREKQPSLGIYNRLTLDRQSGSHTPASVEGWSLRYISRVIIRGAVVEIDESECSLNLPLVL